MKRLILLVAVWLGALGPAGAADAWMGQLEPVTPPMFAGYELRFGALVHDAGSPEAGAADLNAELLLPKLWHSSSAFWELFIPHPDIGFTANFRGKTSNLYGGAAWTVPVTERTFVGLEFGPGLNDGRTGDIVPSGHNKVGCNVWFHESLTGGYRITPQWSVMATVEHSSNAGLCSQNRGLTNYGLRLGYLF